MNEIKIRFKNRLVGYFKLVVDTDKNMENTYNFIGNAIMEGKAGVFEAIDLLDNKRTWINAKEIATIEYSKIQE